MSPELTSCSRSSSPESAGMQHCAGYWCLQLRLQALWLIGSALLGPHTCQDHCKLNVTYTDWAVVGLQVRRHPGSLTRNACKLVKNKELQHVATCKRFARTVATLARHPQ
jgi:hypothetical protein